ncbi:hypothetical protein HDU67_003628, partial [Dinochytrium kinnereticum]
MQKKTEKKKKKLILTRESVLRDFEEWREDVTIALNAEPVPKDYLLILQTAEQMFGKPAEIPAPKQADYKKPSPADGRVQVDDVTAYRKDMQR